MFRLRPKQYKSWLEPNSATDADISRRRPRKKSKKYVYQERDMPIGEHGMEEYDDQRGEGMGNGAALNNFHEPNAIQNLEDPTSDLEQHDEQLSSDAETADVEDEDSHSEDDSQRCNYFNCLDGNQPDEEPQNSEFTFDATQGYADKLNLNDKLMHNLDKTKFDVLLMILTITMRHGMTGSLVEDLLKLVNVIVGTQVLPQSSYIFQRIFSVSSALQYHFICENCNLYLGEHKSFQTSVIECANCQKMCNVKPSILNEGTFFVQLSAKQQLQEIVKRAGQHIISRHQQETDTGRISDIHDGQLFKSLSKEGMPLSNPHSLTVTLGTDGGQVFEKSCRNSMWPVQGICNEQIPTERFRPENMLLAGLWFGKSSPDMTAFLKPLADEFKSMETQGVFRTLSNGQNVVCPGYAIMCVCDSVAKPKLQNIVQFNGFHGCGYCVQRGDFIDQCQKVTYPYNGQKYSLRSEKSVRDAMTLAPATSNKEMGVKGLSPLLLFSSMHLVFGIPIDFLHAIFLGVVKRLLGLWFDESSTGKRYYIKKHENEIDERLSHITPSKIATRPKLITKKSVWKGKDYGSFLLFWGLTCLEGYLHNVYLENFRDLANGIFLLLQESISQEDLNQADLYLSRFTKTYNDYYGNWNMVYNIHLVTHLVQITKTCGPMAFYSAFSFEGGIGLLAKLVKGTNSVASQICRKYLVSKSLPSLLTSHDISPPVQCYCESVLTFNRNKHCISVDGISFLSGEKLHFLNQQERQLLNQAGFNSGDYIETFHRAIYKKKVIASRAYTRPKLTNDTCVQLNSGDYGIVDIIMLLPDPATSKPQCMIFFTPLRLCAGFEKAKHIHSCAGNPYASKVLLAFNLILRKCILYSIGKRQFVTYRPNEFLTNHDTLRGSVAMLPCLSPPDLARALCMGKHRRCRSPPYPW